MTRRDGNTALGALILALACCLRAHGWEVQEHPALREELAGPLSFAGPVADSFGDFTSPVPQRPCSSSIVASGPTRLPAARDDFAGVGACTDFSFPVDGVVRGIPPAAWPGAGEPPLAAPFPPIGPTSDGRDIVFSEGSFPAGWTGGDVHLISYLSADGDPLTAPDLPLAPVEPPGSSLAQTSSGGACYPCRRRLATRFGWWFVDLDGDPTKVGEYQGLDSAPFFDVDSLFSDGVRTIDLFAGGLESEADQIGLDYFGPDLQVDVDFQRYLHRLDHDPLTNMGDVESGEEIVREDLDVGGDYAIRVQELKTAFQCKLTNNVKARLNFRMLRKHGERQATGTQHCMGEPPDSTCHVLSQRQRIDWLTLQIEPVVEGKFGPVRAEYSRPVRIFNQHDQLVTRVYGLHYPAEEVYAFVPENVTQTDRLKLAVDLAANTDFYARLHTGDTHNKFRETHRRFHGFDLRLTNRSCDQVTLTGYATLNEQRNQDLPFFLPDEEEALAVLTSTVPPYGIRHPINYLRTAVGAEACWRPFREGSRCRGLKFTLGCEQGLLERDYAEWLIQDLDDPPGTVVNEDRTTYNSFHVGTSFRWSPCLETYARYRLRLTEDPLFAVNRYYGYTNTSLPEEQNLVEIGGTWTPASNFMATASIGLQDRRHRSAIADFEEDDYPITFTLWYAPTPKWSLSAGYAFYSNWIDQDITFPSDTPEIEVGDTRRWSYGGRGRVLSFGGSYALTRSLTLSGGAQYVWARDAIDPLEPWPDLGDYFDVIVDRTRLNTGVDWSLWDDVSAYFRYIYEDYEDASVDYNSGTAHMFLTGFSRVY